MAEYTKNKMGWYTEVFTIPEPDSDDKASLVVEHLGIVSGLEVHLTVFRPTWVYRFQPYHDTPTIFDRIFGSGTGGMHVTLEQPHGDDEPEPPGIHCYIDGPNSGRTEQEKSELQALLDRYVSTYKAAIDRMRTDYTAFVWQDCDDVDKPFEFLAVDIKTDAFEKIAAIASSRHSLKVVYPAQNDAALLWNTGSIHPLQALQNSHQRLVRDAKRPLDGDAATAKESEELTKYFYFNSQAPKLLGLALDAPPDIATQIEETEKTLAHLEREIPELLQPDIVKHLKAVNEAIWKLRNAFNAGTTPEAKKKAKVIPAIMSAEKNLKGFKAALEAAAKSDDPIAEYEKIRARLQRGYRDLSQAHSGMCCIQNFHTIEPFYLFRLLVKFQIQSKEKIASADRTKVSSSLTGLLHNSAHVSWLFEWLRDKLVEFDAELAKACPEKGPTSKQWPEGEPAVVFFLKGGRAAKYLQGLATKGENDWDTNIVINPNLRAGDWYKTFLIVHNTIVLFLERAKREFTIKVFETASYNGLVQAALEAESTEKGEAEKRRKKKSEAQDAVSMRDLRVMAGGDEVALITDEDLQFWAKADEQLQEFDALERRAKISGSALEEKESENCKAELIDIGIPRRDTIEAFEQWYNVCPRIIKCPDKIPIPGHLYYIAEYVMMVREAFMDKSISMRKTPVRIIRLLEVLNMTNTTLDSLINEEKEHIPTTLAGSLAKVEELDLPLKRMLTILLKQFAEAYALAEDPDLARVFDAAFTKELPNRADKAKYPDSLNTAIANEPSYATALVNNKNLADAIGFAQWMSEDFDKHLTKERAAFIEKQKTVLMNFVKSVYTASFFSQNDDLEVQFAVSGAFAAQLHANYATFDRMKELEPVKRLDLKIYCKPGADPATVLELISPLFDQYKTNAPKQKLPNYEITKFGKGTLLLTWPEAVKFSDTIEYKPTVFKVSVEVAAEDWPALSFIKGLPVLGLRDLIWEYKRKAGHVEETFTQRNLKTATDALIDILTRFENPGSRPWTPPSMAEAEVPGAPEEAPVTPPPQVQAIAVKQVRGVEFIAQKKANWCWAATSLMMRKFYLRERSSIEEVVAEFSPDLADVQSALRLSRLQPDAPTEGRVLSWDDIKAEIEANHPFIIARQGHYLSCYGYEDGGGTKNLLVWDPLPATTGSRKKMTYAQYTAMINAGAPRDQMGATAHKFTIKPRKVLIPLRISEDTYRDGETSVFLQPTDRTLSIQSCEFSVRLPVNALGEPGAQILVVPHDGLPQTFTWDMIVAEQHWSAGRTHMSVLVQVEATLRLDEFRNPSPGLNRVTVMIERPS